MDINILPEEINLRNVDFKEIINLFKETDQILDQTKNQNQDQNQDQNIRNLSIKIKSILKKLDQPNPQWIYIDRGW